MSYLKTFQINAFYGWNNNLGMISLDANWEPVTSLLSTTYSCVKSKSNSSTNISHPVVHFNTLDSYATFMGGRLLANVDRILTGGLAKYYICFWPNSNVSSEYYDANIAEFKSTTDTLYEALDSAVKAGLSSLDASKDLKSAIKKTELKAIIKNAKTPAEVATATAALNVQNSTTITTILCPPPVFTSFAPLQGYTGTIVQVNGRFLSTTKEVKLMNKVVPFKDVTIYNDSTLRFVVPKIATGTVAASGKIEIKTDHGTFTGAVLFNYNPALNGVSSLSPGDATNPTVANTTTTPLANVESINTNPQTTGPVTLLSKYETKSPPNVTDKLTVSVNPSVGAWNIKNEVKMSVSIYELKAANNNITEVLKTTTEIATFTYVVNNVFTVTHQDIKTILFDNPVSPFNTTPINPGEIVSIQFVITADAVDTVKYPKPTVQSFNFVYNKLVTDLPVTTIFEVTPPGSLVKVYESNDVNLPNYSGPDYYNIIKPAGGYITFKFNCVGLISKGAPEVFLIPEFKKQNITVTNSNNTKYTNVINVNNLGKFQLGVGYTSDKYTFLNTATNIAEPINTTATSPPFTL